MTVMELKALPLGFRFHPTDEELVRHYLKGKITGQINSEVEVIPEINVYKCEPWDLPDKSLIRSDDPEWFFFTPKDRKHPNGSRSNRSTEAGYWKATGKDRVIRSKGDKRKQHIIGMKKTLVFHKGRAPKGERMGWIMHEYRTTEPDFECGKQGGYVLYRLFRKQEEKNERSSPEEVDRSGYSPTPRSSPDNMESNEETLTPLNKESPESTLHFSPINLPNSVEAHAVPMTRWLEDRTDNLTANAMNISRMPLDEHIDGVAKFDPSAGGLSQLIDSQKQHGDPNHFALGGAAVLPHEGNGFFTDFQQGFMGLDGNMNTPDAIDEFLNQTIADPDEHSLTTSKVQCVSDTGILPPEFENHGIVQGELPEDERWWEGLSFLPEEPIPQFSGLYENASLIPYDATDQDVFSMDSGVESLQDLFNNMEDSSGKRDGWSTEPAMQETGITFMPRLQSSVQQNYLSPNQGIAQRRIRLLESLSPKVESEESVTNVDCEDETSCIVTSKYLDEAVEESTTEKGVQSDKDDAESTGITIRSTTSSFTQQGIAPRRLQLQLDLTTGPCSTTNDSSSCIMDKTKSQHNARKSKIEEDSGTNFAVSVDLSGSCYDYEQNDMPEHDALKAVPEAKSVPRLRKTSEKSEKVTKQEDGADSVVRAQGRREASNYIPDWFFQWLCCCFSVLGCMNGSDGYSGGI